MTTAAQIRIDAEFSDDHALVDAIRIIEGVMGYIADNVVVTSQESTPAPVQTHEIPHAVFVRERDEEDGMITVSGDVNELTYFLSPHQLAVFRLSLPKELQLGDSANYAIVPFVQRHFPSVSLDPEHSCFFAYTDDADVAQRLADAINDLEWAVPA